MNRRIRLIPIVIFGAAFMATLKLGSVIQGVGGLVAATSAAESGAQEEPAAAQDGPNKGATTKEIRVAGKAAEKSSDAGEPGADDAKDKVKKKGEWVDPAAMTGAELEVLQSFSARRKVLDKRAKELELRRNLLQATERRVDTKLAELKQIQATINALLRRHSKQKEEQMRSVVKIYENMKPKDAARIFEQMDMTILLDVVERMCEAKTAPIMANMSPVKAKSVMVALVKRRALPKPDIRKR